MRCWLLVLMLSGAFVGLASCGSDSATCGKTADCSDGQVCESGSCVTPSQVVCTGDPDCRPGFTCSEGSCQPLPRFDMGMDMDRPDIIIQPDLPEEDLPVQIDNVNPTVVSVTPANGTAEVPLNPTISVVFSEPMNPATINFFSLLLKNPAGQDVPSQVSYDVDTMTATLTPEAPLYPATGYRVVPTDLLRDLADNSLRIVPSPDAIFYTELSIPEKHTEIALEFAPAIYQSLETTDPGPRNIDTPTTIDFDGDGVARNNKANALLATVSTPTNVYYSVVESQTHYFITYTLYYPVRRDKNANLNHEHDFTGAVFVVDKETRTLKLVEGLRVDDGNDTVMAFKPSQSDVFATGSPQFLETVNEADYVDGRYPMFITSGSHEACHWTRRGPTVPAVCRHEPREFSEGPTQGVLMKPGEAQVYNQSVLNEETQIREMEYGLEPLAGLWARRLEVGEEMLWEVLSVYETIEGRPSRYPDESPVVLPNRLFSNDETTFGKPPFAWLKLSSANNQGQWLFDPAFILQVRYGFGEGFSAEYCHNVYLGLDARTTAECLEEE